MDLALQDSKNGKAHESGSQDPKYAALNQKVSLRAVMGLISRCFAIVCCSVTCQGSLKLRILVLQLPHAHTVDTISTFDYILQTISTRHNVSLHTRTHVPKSHTYSILLQMPLCYFTPLPFSSSAKCNTVWKLHMNQFPLLPQLPFS